MKFCFVAAFAFFWFHLAAAQPGSYQMHYVKVARNTVDVHSITRTPDSLFTSFQDNLRLGWVDDDVWIRIEYSLEGSEPCYLALNQPLISEVEFSYQKDGVIHTEYSGAAHKSQENPYTSHNFVLPTLTAGKHSRAVCWLKISTRYPLETGIEIVSVDKWMSTVLREAALLWTLLGVILGMIMFNLLLHFTTRESSYAWYVSYLLSFMITFAIIFGYVQFLRLPIPEPVLITIGGTFTVAVVIFLNEFSRHYLKITRQERWQRIVINVLQVINGLAILIQLLSPPKIVQLLGFLMSTINMISLIVIAIWLRRMGRATLIYLSALGISTMGFFVFMLAIFEYLPLNFYTTHAVQFGMCGEALLFSLALGYRVRALEQEKFKKVMINRQLLEATIVERTKELTELNRNLEHIVSSRTEDLRIMNDDLARANRDLGDFVYRSYHDLRGPLARIRGLVNVGIIEKGIPQANLVLLENECNTLIRTFRKLTVYWNLKSLDEEKQVLNIRYEVSVLIDNLRRERFFKHDLSIHNLVEEHFQIETYRTALMAALYEILENAVIFGSGHIVVTATFSAERGLKICVIDDGEGVPTEYASRIFDRNFRVSGQSNGAGFGLYLAKFASEKLGAKLVYERNDGETFFCLTKEAAS